MKKVGIWLDKRQAIIVTLLGKEETVQYMPSQIEEFHVKGGSGTRAKGGPQDVVQDSKYLEREKHQYKSYFDNLVPFLKSADSVALFGPAETAMRFYKSLQEFNKEIGELVKDVQKADSMTENQTKALVRDFFAKA